jgi:hypothetical protein
VPGSRLTWLPSAGRTGILAKPLYTWGNASFDSKSLVVSHTHDPVIGMWRNSMRLVGFIVHACVGRDPVYFPSLAPIIRECLFKAARIRSDIRHDKSNVDGSAIKAFLVEKLGAPIVELADRGLVQGTVDAVGKIEAPLVGLGIVQTQG